MTANPKAAPIGPPPATATSKGLSTASTVISKPVTPASAALRIAYESQIRRAREREPPGPGTYDPTKLTLPSAPRLVELFLRQQFSFDGNGRHVPRISSIQVHEALEIVGKLWQLCCQDYRI
jgi:hypothetical protein